MTYGLRQNTLLLGLLAIPPSIQPEGPPFVSPTRSAVATAASRDAPAGDRARFRSGVDLVALDVCVKGRDGHVIGDLGRDDFLVFEDGVPQPISLFVPDGRAPLAVTLVVDRSASMEGERLARAKAAAITFVETLKPHELVEVITFNDRAARPVPLGTDHQKAAEAIMDIEAGGSTGLFEAIAVGLHDLSRLPTRLDIDFRRALVVLSDGEDTSSRLAFEDLLDDARRSGVLIYAISLRTDERGRWLPAPYPLTGLAWHTGGRAVPVEDLSSLKLIYHEIAAELRQLYRVGYVPLRATRDGSWRSIAVRVRDRNAQVRTRAGYFAPRSTFAFARDGR